MIDYAVFVERKVLSKFHRKEEKNWARRGQEGKTKKQTFHTLRVHPPVTRATAAPWCHGAGISHAQCSYSISN